MNYTTSEENYLKAIFHLQVQDEIVTTTALATKLDTKPASVTDMMKKLNAKKLLNYKPYYGFSLSQEGKKIALHIIRRHRLWEYFLSEKLKFDWNEIHNLAEELEHVNNKKLIERLDEYLNYPQFDPHGDPIPDSKGKIKKSKKISLADLPFNKAAEVCQVSNQTNEMLELLNHKNIGIGTKIEVKRYFNYDQSFEIKIKSSFVTISETLAKNIYVSYEQDN